MRSCSKIALLGRVARTELTTDEAGNASISASVNRREETRFLLRTPSRAVGVFRNCSNSSIFPGSTKRNTVCQAATAAGSSKDTEQAGALSRVLFARPL